MARWVEITTKIGCKNMCSYCPQNTFISTYNKMYPGGKKNMTLDDFKKILSNVPKDVHIHFSGFSESMLNDESVDMMIHANQEGYEVVLYSTLVGFDEIKAEKFKQSGMRFNHTRPHEFDGIGFDFSEFYRKNDLLLNSVKTGDHYVNKVLAPTSRGGHLRDVGYKGERIRCAGNRVFNNVVLPNGEVFLCCCDWSLKHRIGNLFENGYDSEEFRDARQQLINLQDTFNSDLLCRTCEESFRV